MKYEGIVKKICRENLCTNCRSRTKKQCIEKNTFECRSAGHVIMGIIWGLSEKDKQELQKQQK